MRENGMFWLMVVCAVLLLIFIYACGGPGGMWDVGP